MAKHVVTIEAEQWFQPKKWGKLYPYLDTRPKYKNFKVIMADEGWATLGGSRMDSNGNINDGDFLVLVGEKRYVWTKEQFLNLIGA